jgi:hypothetical protein
LDDWRQLQAEDAGDPRQDEGTELRVDELGLKVGIVVVGPPVHEAEERPNEKPDHDLELPRVMPLVSTESPELRTREIVEPALGLAPSHIAALATGDDPEHLLARPEVAE